MDREDFTKKGIKDGDLVVIVCDTNKRRSTTRSSIILKAGLYSHNESDTPSFSLGTGVTMDGRLSTPPPNYDIPYANVLYVEKVKSINELREIYKDHRPQTLF